VVDNADEGGPLSKDVAGYHLIFIVSAIPFCWFIIYLFEKKPFESISKIKSGA